MAKAGRPKGWSPKTGWKKTGLLDQAHERRLMARDDLEALFCAQIVRIQAALDYRYAFDAKIRDGEAHIASGNRYHVMPQNDHMTRGMVMQDCEQVIKR